MGVQGALESHCGRELLVAVQALPRSYKSNCRDHDQEENETGKDSHQNGGGEIPACETGTGFFGNLPDRLKTRDQLRDHLPHQ